METNRNDESDLTYFSEQEEAKILIGKICFIVRDDEAVESIQRLAKHCTELKEILEKYQEAPHLLKSHLHQLVDPLVELFRTCLTPLPQDQDTLPDVTRETDSVKTVYRLGENYDQYDGDRQHSVQHEIAKLLYCISKVVSFKTLVPFFPHDVRCVLDVTHTLLEWNLTHQQQACDWETAYVLLLWMSNAVLVPFSLEKFDHDLGTKIVALCTSLLKETSRVQDAAAFLLAKLFSRPDTAVERSKFISWCASILKSSNSAVDSIHTISNLRYGLLMTMARLMKAVKRQDLIGQLHVLEHFILSPTFLEKNSANGLTFRLVVKAVQRFALLPLPPSIGVWIYKKKAHTLLTEAKDSTEMADACLITNEDEKEELVVLPECMEIILDTILRALRHTDTVVRWSAAKGIGRLCSRFPQDAASEVVEAVREMFEVAEEHSAWHGGSLALAELIRRGVIQPTALSSWVPILLRALQYDVLCGSHSVGSHVRDAGCYISWCCARAYEPSSLQNYVQDMSSELLYTACFDREVNVRRAAAAAFQECVGRLGSFPHGIEIVTTADYFSLALRKQAFTDVALAVAQYLPYGPYFLARLCRTTISHWDREVRALAAQAVGLLAKMYPEIFIQNHLTEVLHRCYDKSIEARSGSLLTMAEVIGHVSHKLFSEKQVEDLVMIVPTLEAKRLFRGRGGEGVRLAACHLISALARAEVPMPKTLEVQRAVSSIGSSSKMTHRTLQIYHTVLEDCIKQPDAVLQDAAMLALMNIYQHFTEVNADKASPQEDTVQKMIDMLRPCRPVSERRGYVLALGALPKNIFEETGEVGTKSGDLTGKVLSAFLDAVRIEVIPGHRDADSRKNAVVALSRWSHRIWTLLSDQQRKDVIEALFLGARDFSIDKRGDVGSIVRMNAITALISVLVHDLPLKNGNDSVCYTAENDSWKFAMRVLGVCFHQVFDKIDRVRAHVSNEIRSLAMHLRARHHTLFQHLEKEFALFLNDHVDWLSTSTFAALIPVALSSKCEEIASSSLKGVVISTGSMSLHVARAACAAFSSYLRSGEQVMLVTVKRLVDYLQELPLTSRALAPCLKTLEVLFTSGLLPECFHLIIVEHLGKEVTAAKASIRKLLLIVELMASLCASSNKEVHILAIRYSLFLVAHPSFPKLRSNTATSLYSALLSSPQDVPNRVGEVILETEWESEEWESIVLPAQQELLSVLQVSEIETLEVKILRDTLPRTSNTQTGMNFSYAGLVQEAGY